MSKGWIGVDFDGTLATYEYGQFPEVGKPIVRMVNRVLKWLEEGRDVRILTARLANSTEGDDGCAYETPEQQRIRIEDWCYEHIGRVLPVTAEKNGGMIELWDDRAIRVERNTGKIAKSIPRRGSKKR